ncbi:hypothetical protein A2U01_0050256, partial [Trifolium medium]|nr:hypothetical protein [Trifolium medium]
MNKRQSISPCVIIDGVDGYKDVTSMVMVRTESLVPMKLVMLDSVVTKAERKLIVSLVAVNERSRKAVK